MCAKWFINSSIKNWKIIFTLVFLTQDLINEEFEKNYVINLTFFYLYTATAVFDFLSHFNI